MNFTVEDLLLIIGDKEVTIAGLRKQLQEALKKLAEKDPPSES